MVCPDLYVIGQSVAGFRACRNWAPPPHLSMPASIRNGTYICASLFHILWHSMHPLSSIPHPRDEPVESATHAPRNAFIRQSHVEHTVSP
jgi:hypothetical protein